MAIRALIMALSVAAGISASSIAFGAPALTCESPQAHVVHPKWFRPGGYCDVIVNLSGAIGVGAGGAFGGGSVSGGITVIDQFVVHPHSEDITVTKYSDGSVKAYYQDSGHTIVAKDGVILSRS